MSHSLQGFLAEATTQAAKSLEEALLRLPKDRRNWQPAASSRSALDLVAECALMNGRIAEIVLGGEFPSDWAHIYFQDEIEELGADWAKLQRLLHDNTALVAQIIHDLSNKVLDEQEDLADTISYPYWNMTYHEGQINYIASQLGCLD